MLTFISSSGQQSIMQNKVLEWSVFTKVNYDNPFYDVTVYAVVKCPDVKSLKIPSFRKGNGEWRVPAAPILHDRVMIFEKMKRAGLRLFYHPHGYEFNTVDGNLMDKMLAETKPEYVTFELDVFWMIHGGGDPFEYLNKYPGRFELFHLKELRHDVIGNNTGGAPDPTSVSLGRGPTDWPRLLRLAAKSGVKKYYIEDEAKDAIDQVPVTVKYLNSLR